MQNKKNKKNYLIQYCILPVYFVLAQFSLTISLLSYLLPDDFWCEVLRGAAERVSGIWGLQALLAEPEVGEHDVARAVEQQVLRLEVTVHDLSLVQVAQGRGNLSTVEARTRLWEGALSL